MPILARSVRREKEVSGTAPGGNCVRGSHDDDEHDLSRERKGAHDRNAIRGDASSVQIKRREVPERG